MGQFPLSTTHSYYYCHLVPLESHLSQVSAQVYTRRLYASHPAKVKPVVTSDSEKRRSHFRHTTHFDLHNSDPTPKRNPKPKQLPTTIMTDSMPMPTARAQLPRNDSFSTHDIHQAFKASASKPRNNLSLRVVQQDETAPPPPSPLDSRPASAFGFGPAHRR